MSMAEIKYSGPSAATLLTLLFIGLKLTNCIDWSWWWVLSPIWLPFTAVISSLLIVIFVLVIFTVIKGAFAK